MDMFNTFKSKIAMVFGPMFGVNLNNEVVDLTKPSVTDRKQYNRDSQDEDCCIITPPHNQDRKRRQLEEQEDCLTRFGKRKKLTELPNTSAARRLSVWNLNNVFEYVVGRKMNRKNSSSKNQPQISNREYSDSNTQEQNFIRTVKKKDSHRCTLSQISNATILDLSNIDESTDEGEVTITKVAINLDNTLPNSSKKISKENSLKLKRHSAAISGKPFDISTSDETFRLEEKQRYKELLSQFTTISLPEYSESISPTKKVHRATGITNTEDIRIISNVSSNPLFVKKTTKKPIMVDLTKSQNTLLSPKKREFIDLSAGEYSTADLEPEYTSLMEDSMPYLSSFQTNLKTKCTPGNIILSTDWTKKWREALDPASLERDRRIKEEERKKDALKRKQQEEFEKLNKSMETTSNEFPELSADVLLIVKQALSVGNPGDIIVQGFNAEVKRGDIATLRDTTWLNDEIVNFYFNLVKARSEQDETLPKVHVFNTFFYPKIMKVGHAGVRRWTRKIDIFAVDLVLIPIHLGMHWCLAVIDFKNKEIIYYDSLKGNNTDCIAALKKYIVDESNDKKKVDFHFDGWKELIPKDIPEQMNGCDCGVFTCKYAEYKSRYSKFTFTQDHMPYFRKRMIYEIISKTLM